MLPEGGEKAKVVQAFLSTLGHNISVVSVERVQNMSMWQVRTHSRLSYACRGSPLPFSTRR